MENLVDIVIGKKGRLQDTQLIMMDSEPWAAATLGDAISCKLKTIVIQTRLYQIFKRFYLLSGSSKMPQEIIETGWMSTYGWLVNIHQGHIRISCFQSTGASLMMSASRKFWYYFVKFDVFFSPGSRFGVTVDSFGLLPC